MRNSRIEVRPISGAGGAEISGVDISRDLDDGTIGEIRDALNEHCVVFFRDQEIDVAQHKAFARRFGPIFVHPNFATVMEDPEVVMVRREPADVSHVGEDWHTDTTMCAEPPMGAILYAVEVPPYGGDTLFANQYLAFDSLSDGMKRMVSGLRAVHSDIRVAGPRAGLNARRAIKVREDANWRPTESVHPVVRTHPETGRKALYVNVAHTAGIVGMPPEQSEPLLQHLFQHQVKPDYTCRFQWRAGAGQWWNHPQWRRWGTQ